MAQAPVKRPITMTFVFGKGVVKQRSAVNSIRRFLLENALIDVSNTQWDSIRVQLRQRIADDARAELVRVSAAFRRGVIGVPENYRGLRGTLKPVAQGDGAPSTSLGNLPRWAPRGSKYLNKKRQKAKHARWFDNTGWAPHGGRMKEFFESDQVQMASGAMGFVGSAGIFEDMFGPIKVTVQRQGEAKPGAFTLLGKGSSHKLQLAKIRVVALSKIQDRMLTFSSQPNAGLLAAVAGADGGREIAYRLRGGRGRYRPTLEPFLEFYLRKALPFAVAKRIERAGDNGTLFRRAGRS